MENVMEKTVEKSPCLKTLNIDGDRYKTNFTRKYEMRKEWHEPDFSKIYAVLPGNVVKLYVQPGQQVKLGDKLLVFEAMKMKNILSSPMDGIIKSVFVAEGKNIAKRDLLIEIE